MNPPYEILTTSQLYKLHLASIEILEEVGVQIPSEEALKLCGDAGAEVDLKNRIVKIPQYLVEECIRKTPHKVILYGRDLKLKLLLEEGNVYFGTVGFATRIIDINTGQYRSLNREDLAKLTRVADALENIDFQLVMGQPIDVPLEMAELYQWLIAFENTRKHIVCQALSKRNAEIAVEMGSIIAGDKEELRKHPIMTFIICLNSPLLFGEGLTEALIVASKYGVPVWVESGPLAGANSPVTLAGTVALNNAEVLAGLVISKLVNLQSPFIYGSWSRSIDMRTGSVVLGGPEFALMRICTAQLARYYKIPSGGGGILCDSKTSDAQAGYEKMLTAILPAIARINLVCGIGLVGSENIASFEQLVIDNEIVGIAKRVLNGIRLDDDTLAIDTIKEVGHGGNFLPKKHTLKFAKIEHYIPRISDRSSPDTWIRTGMKNTSQRAREQALKILSEYSPVSLPKEVSEKLQSLILKLKTK